MPTLVASRFTISSSNHEKSPSSNLFQQSWENFIDTINPPHPYHVHHALSTTIKILKIIIKKKKQTQNKIKTWLLLLVFFFNNIKIWLLRLHYRKNKNSLHTILILYMWQP